MLRLTVNFYHGGEDSKVFGRYENGRIDVNIDRVDKSLAQQGADHIKGMRKRLYEGITGKHYEAKVA